MNISIDVLRYPSRRLMNSISLTLIEGEGWVVLVSERILDEGDIL